MVRRGPCTLVRRAYWPRRPCREEERVQRWRRGLSRSLRTTWLRRGGAKRLLAATCAHALFTTRARGLAAGRARKGGVGVLGLGEATRSACGREDSAAWPHRARTTSVTYRRPQTALAGDGSPRGGLSRVSRRPRDDRVLSSRCLVRDSLGGSLRLRLCSMLYICLVNFLPAGRPF